MMSASTDDRVRGEIPVNHGVAVLLEFEALLTDRVVASTNGQKGEVNASRTTRSA
jgi:hypothetical protein